MLVTKRNPYNLRSFNIYSRGITLDSNGDEVTMLPSAPTNVTLTELSSGYVRVDGVYAPGADASPADKFAIYIDEGADPDPATDTPTYVTMTSGYGFFSPTRRLAHTIGPYAVGADIRVIVTAYRTSDTSQSANTTASQITITRSGPSIPTYPLIGLGQQLAQDAPRPATTRTVYVDVPNNIRFELALGVTELWGGSALIWRLKYNTSVGVTNNGFWTTYGFRQEAISGTPGTVTNGVEVASWTGSDKTLYIPVAGVRRMKIDVTNQLIHAAAMRQTGLTSSYDTDPIVVMTFHTLMQVWEWADWNYETVASLDTDGVLALGVPWRQRQTVGDFE
jgi:hypothetical protein